MKFFEGYNTYKQNKSLVNKFIKNIEAVKTISILDDIYLECNHTLMRNDSHATIVAYIDYPEDIEYIEDILQLEHGIFYHGSLNPEKFPSEIINVEHYELITKDNPNILKCDINNSRNSLTDKQWDNYKRKITFSFDFKGEMNDLDLLNEYTYYVYIKANVINQTAPYWSNLMIQALNLEKEMKHELALLVMFSAFDNFISLEIEKLNEMYFKEINLLTLEFGKKVSLLLKHFLNVVPGSNNEEHPVRNLITEMYEELYILRNAVAHGNIRNIEEDDFHKCLDMLIFTYTAKKYSPINNDDLLRKIKLF